MKRSPVSRIHHHWGGVTVVNATIKVTGKGTKRKTTAYPRTPKQRHARTHAPAVGVAVIDRGAGLDQNLHNLGVALEGGVRQRRVSHGVGNVDVGALGQRPSNLARLSFLCPMSQSRVGGTHFAALYPGAIVRSGVGNEKREREGK